MWHFRWIQNSGLLFSFLPLCDITYSLFLFIVHISSSLFSTFSCQSHTRDSLREISTKMHPVQTDLLSSSIRGNNPVLEQTVEKTELSLVLKMAWCPLQLKSYPRNYALFSCLLTKYPIHLQIVLKLPLKTISRVDPFFWICTDNHLLQAGASSHVGYGEIHLGLSRWGKKHLL